jgi:hypothetical protein
LRAVAAEPALSEAERVSAASIGGDAEHQTEFTESTKIHSENSVHSVEISLPAEVLRRFLVINGRDQRHIQHAGAVVVGEDNN